MEIFFAKADQILNIVSQHSPLWIYFFVLISMIIENFFPPYPGDVAVFICGTYAAGGHASWVLIYILSIVGTLISVMSLYYFGRSKGRDIFHNKRVKWLHVEKLKKVERLYEKYGDRMLLLSRYLTGIRALVALFAGVGRVSARRMLFFSLISTLTFNFILLYLALRLRQDYHKIEPLFRAYNGIIITILLIILVILLVRYYLNRRRTRTP